MTHARTHARTHAHGANYDLPPASRAGDNKNRHRSIILEPEILKNFTTFGAPVLCTQP